MTGKFLLIVSDEKDDSHAEVAMLDSALETERRVESLLAAGFDADKIRVFTGGQTGVTVTHRPVVHLTKRDSGEATHFTADPADRVEPEAVTAHADQDSSVSNDVEPELVPVGAHAEPQSATPDDGNDSAISTGRILSISRSVDEVRNEAAPAPVAAVSHDAQPTEEVRFSDLFRRAYVG